jgi:hypothetical protein
MINPDAELDRLRWRLQDSGWEYSEIETIVDEASGDVNELILDIVSNAVAEATDYAQDLGADDFIEEMDVQEAHGFFRISTISGKTDYSTPERQMLLDLLRNAKENPETGIKSRVIPVGAGSGKNKVMGDIFSVMKDRQAKIDQARSALIDNNMNNRSERAVAMASRFRDILGRNLADKRTEQKVQTPKKDITFRTVSSEQNPAEDWVYPAKEMDLTGYLMDLNKRMEDSMVGVIPRLIDTYIEEYS